MIDTCFFTYVITKNCNYNCIYCNAHKEENFLSLNQHQKICKFITDFCGIKTDEQFSIMLFGGECTLDPNINNIIDMLSNKENIELNMFSNFSGNMSIYEKLCSNPTSKYLHLTWHQNHVELSEYQERLNYLLSKYDKITISAQCAIGKNRLTENEIMLKFKPFFKYKNFNISVFPLHEYDGSENIIDENNIKIYLNTNKIDNLIDINKTDLNINYNKKCDCVKTNPYIYNGKLYNCYKYNTLPLIDILDDDKAIKKYSLIREKIRFVCKEKYCYKNAKTTWHSKLEIDEE
jgi:organic radical activating enzyme